MKIGVAGLGLMGASFARALVKKTVHEPLGYDISEEVMKKAELLGCFERRLTAETAGEIDLLAVFVYPSVFSACAREWLPYLKAGATVIDCAGTKRLVASEMKKLAEEFPSVNFIATHPMAGREFSGAEHSTASLYENCSWLVCPVRASLESVSALKNLLFEAGARKFVYTTPAEHDRVIAYTSQLCHIVSSAFVKSETRGSILGFTAGSFRDLTRVAKLNPEMWAELFLQNSDFLTEEIKFLEEKLREYRLTLETGDGEKLKELLLEGTEKKNETERAYQRFLRDGEN